MTISNRDSVIEPLDPIKQRIVNRLVEQLGADRREEETVSAFAITQQGGLFLTDDELVHVYKGSHFRWMIDRWRARDLQSLRWQTGTVFTELKLTIKAESTSLRFLYHEQARQFRKKLRAWRLEHQQGGHVIRRHVVPADGDFHPVYYRRSPVDMRIRLASDQPASSLDVLDQQWQEEEYPYQAVFRLRNRTDEPVEVILEGPGAVEDEEKIS